LALPAPQAQAVETPPAAFPLAADRAQAKAAGLPGSAARAYIPKIPGYQTRQALLL